MANTLGIPYARHQRDQSGQRYLVCPQCSLRIDLQHKKDFESFSGLEYQNHVAAKHGREESTS